MSEAAIPVIVVPDEVVVVPGEDAEAVVEEASPAATMAAPSAQPATLRSILKEPTRSPTSEELRRAFAMHVEHMTPEELAGMSERVFFRTLRRKFETTFSLAHGAMDARRDEVKELLIAYMPDDESSFEAASSLPPSAAVGGGHDGDLGVDPGAGGRMGAP